MNDQFRGNLIITIACAVFSYLWTENDKSLNEILIATTKVSTQIDSNRREWELREGRILAALDKQSVTIDRLMEVTNRHSMQIVAMQERLNSLEKALRN